MWNDLQIQWETKRNSEKKKKKLDPKALKLFHYMWTNFPETGNYFKFNQELPRIYKLHSNSLFSL